MTESDFAPFMREALSLAELGRWKTYPNPAVGAVLVRDGRILARGFHHAAGEAHAEVECLKDAAARGVDPAAAPWWSPWSPATIRAKLPPAPRRFWMRASAG